ncbi:hypothetical protein OEZ85_004518 [Tetradesmus obliquus]|uniref:TRP C-terminal domain-containing protein n=1 Tax=Tetradesmus obliquus TaxID=3088 RepID=A0ABY8ULD8_TETOB|nr:hypothetical protein OEZ85_004518 [Tetradesmus obliquus]
MARTGGCICSQPLENFLLESYYNAGGALVTPLSGFWHAAGGREVPLYADCSLDEVIRCPNQQACNHSVSELVTRNLYNPNATLVASSWEEYGTLLCSNQSGYTGLLCASCKPGFGQTDAFTCSACLGVSANGQGEVNRRKIWGLLATYGAAFIVVVWSTIWWGVQESHTQEPEPDDRGRGVHGHGMHVVDVIKALAMYAQYFAGVIAKLPVELPDSVSTTFGWLAAHKQMLQQPRFMERFGFLYSDYEVHLKQQAAADGARMFRDVRAFASWCRHRTTLVWDAVIHLQTVALMFISVYGMMMHEYYQVLILTVVFGIYLILVVWLRPFRVHANQQLQAASTAVLFSTSLCMLTFIKPDGLDAQQQKGYEKVKDAMGVVVLAVNALFVAIGLVLLVTSAIKLAKKTLSKEQEAEQQGNAEAEQQHHQQQQQQQQGNARGLDAA